jgi:uracil-DNA glycosylase
MAFDAALRHFAPAEDARSRPTFGHAASHPLADGRWLVASYHPSRQNTQTGRLTAEMFDRVWTQVKQRLASDLAP